MENEEMWHKKKNNKFIYLSFLAFWILQSMALLQFQAVPMECVKKKLQIGGNLRRKSFRSIKTWKNIKNEGLRFYWKT